MSTSVERRRASAGIVIIGRNEGERLCRCIDSVTGAADAIVYVDSGSSDGSAEMATARGVAVVVLDTTRTFTAARARNAGVTRLLELGTDLTYVQFVDGDCEVIAGWLATAIDFLDREPRVAVVCGRLRERFPDRSAFNRLCDMEWDRPAGVAKACGGIAMMRLAVFESAGRFREELIAGEEPELCVRIRAQGWQVWRLAAPMAWHDAAMTRFGQWWRRAMRGGHAAAEGMSLHGAPPERHGVVTTRRALVWGLALPSASVLGMLWSPWALALLLAYPMQWLRLALRDGIGDVNMRLRALFYVLAAFPEAQGVLRFWLQRRRGHRSTIIEYKQPHA